MKTSRFVLTVLVAASLVAVDAAYADEVTKDGYLLDSPGGVVKSGFDLCWHTGFWTPDMAIAECDLVKVAEAPAPVVAPEQPAPIIITLQSDTLFVFDKSVIRAEGRKNLDDEVIGKMREYPQIELVLVTGHADRIGSDAYNQQLAQRCADAVKDYLVEQGVDATRIETASKGESEPIVTCDEIKGKVSGKNKALVECLKPNRRVVVEIKAQQPVQRQP